MIYRTDKNSDRYTRLSNNFLRDKRLSLKAKGVLALCLSESDDWNFSVSGLASFSKDGEAAVASALDELERCGYITRVKRERSGGRFTGYDFDIYEEPQAILPDGILPDGENRDGKSGTKNKQKRITKTEEQPSPKNTSKVLFTDLGGDWL